MLRSAGRQLHHLVTEDVVVPDLSPALLKTTGETATRSDGVASIGMNEIDWAARWRQLIEDRATLASGHADSHYWDRRAGSFARSTHARAEKLEWVTAVEPSEGMRSHIPPRDNITIVASTWEDAEVAAADLVICSHVMYGVAEPVPFLEKMQRSARERVFVMMRETDLPHPAAELRRRLVGEAGPRLPRFSELFMLLVQMGIAPDVRYLRYAIVTRYADMEEAMADCRALFGEGWDESAARAELERLLRREGDVLVYDGGVALSGVAHWQPSKS